MSLKSKRLDNPYGYDLAWYGNTVMTRGGIVCAATIGSGTAMEQSENVVEYSASPSGKLPVGMLMSDTESIDLTKHYTNPYGAVSALGTKVSVQKQGTYTTNSIYPGLTIAAQQVAYLGPSGLLQNTKVNEVNNPYVGQFMSSKDADGYAKVTINLPANK